jgi:pimeloyl-ACP methyl ester carboxylesterase
MTSSYKSEAGGRAVEARYRQFLGRWPVANRQFHVPTCEGDTFVVACGPENAPPLLLLHGSASNSFMWMGDVAAWSEHFRIYAIDMIGEPGLSAPSRPPLAGDAHRLWLDDVLKALSLSRVSLVGISLGGWLALDYATKSPERVDSIVLLCPGGVGRHKNVLLWALPLLLMGPWGRRKVTQIIAGPRPPGAASANPVVTEFLALIFRAFKVRRERLPVFTDEALKRLTMPVLAIVGGKDVMVDSPGIKKRLEQNAPRAEIRWLPDAGHFLTNQTAPVLEFLRRATKVRSHA